MNLYRSLAPGLVLLASACSMQIALGQAATQDDRAMTVQEAEYLAQSQAKWKSLTPRTGEIALPGGFATINVPEQYYYLDPADTAAVLEHTWGNPPGKKTLGMLMPQKYTPFDYASWAVKIEYVQNGYTSDADAHTINYADLLSKMQKETRLKSDERALAGYGTVELVGWAEAPHYSAQDKHMYWARELLFNEDERALSYDMRVLGRQGMLSMTFMATPDQLVEVQKARDDVLAMATFNEGFRYADFNPVTDTLADFGVDTLIAGTLPSKPKLVTTLLLFLLKMGIGVLIIVGLVLAVLKHRSASYDIARA